MTAPRHGEPAITRLMTCIIPRVCVTAPHRLHAVRRFACYMDLPRCAPWHLGTLTPWHRHTSSIKSRPYCTHRQRTGASVFYQRPLWEGASPSLTRASRVLTHPSLPPHAHSIAGMGQPDARIQVSDNHIATIHHHAMKYQMATGQTDGSNG